jgi:hypothetical protein
MTQLDPQAKSLLEAMHAAGQPRSSPCRSLMPGELGDASWRSTRPA